MSSISRNIPIASSSSNRYQRHQERSIDHDEEMEKDTGPNAAMSASYSEILNPDIPMQLKNIDYDEKKYKKNSKLEKSNSNSTTEDELAAITGAIPKRYNNKQDGERPKSLINNENSEFPYNLEGTVSKEGDITNFVAKDLEYKIRLSSPSTKDSPTCSTSPSTSGIITRQFLSAHNNLPQIDSNVLNDIELEAQYLAASADNLIENLGNLLHSISSITSDNVEIHRNSVTKLTDCMDANIKIMYTIMAKTEEITQSMKPCEQLAQRIQQIKKFVDMLESNL